MMETQVLSVKVGKKKPHETKAIRHVDAKERLMDKFSPTRNEEFDTVYGAVLYVIYFSGLVNQYLIFF